jgi:hypothetical protein
MGMKRTPMRRASKKQVERLREYRVLKNEFLWDHPFCQWPGCTKLSQDIHHKAGRGKNLNNTETWAALCRAHHDEAHRRPGQARKIGMLI